MLDKNLDPRNSEYGVYSYEEGRIGVKIDTIFTRDMVQACKLLEGRNWQAVNQEYHGDPEPEKTVFIKYEVMSSF